MKKLIAFLLIMVLMVTVASAVISKGGSSSGTTSGVISKGGSAKGSSPTEPVKPGGQTSPPNEPSKMGPRPSDPVKIKEETIQQLLARKTASEIQRNLDAFLVENPSVFSVLERAFRVTKNELIHVRIENKNLAIIIKNGRADRVAKSPPANPTLFIDTYFKTLDAIRKAGNPLNQAFKEVWAGNIKIHRPGRCAADTQCGDSQVCNSGVCENAFVLTVVPLGYSSGERGAYLSKAVPEIDYFLNKLPEGNVRVHIVEPTVCRASCKDACRECQRAVSSCVSSAGLSGVTDKSIGISKNDLTASMGSRNVPVCGCAGGIPSSTSVARSFVRRGSGYACKTTVAHELGHAFGLYHVNSYGSEAGACIGVNAADCHDSNKNSDLMGYRHPRTHYGPAAMSFIDGQLRRYSQ